MLAAPAIMPNHFQNRSDWFELSEIGSITTVPATIPQAPGAVPGCGVLLQLRVGEAESL